MSDTTLSTERLRELLARATPGDWKPVHATENCGPYVTALLWRGNICDLYFKHERGRTIHNEEYAAANVELLAASKALAARVIEQGAEIERLRDENEKLRADLRLPDREAWGGCEACGAPLFHDDITLSGDDVSGCWPSMTDDESANGKPCYAYRGGKPSCVRAALKGGE